MGRTISKLREGGGEYKNHLKVACTEKRQEIIVCNKILKEKIVCTKISHRESQHSNQDF